MGGEALPSLAPQQTSRWSGVTAGVRAYGKQVWVDHIRLVRAAGGGARRRRRVAARQRVRLAWRLTLLTAMHFLYSPQVLYGIQYALRPHTVLTLVASCVCVWLCAPNRLALSWDSNFQGALPNFRRVAAGAPAAAHARC